MDEVIAEKLWEMLDAIDTASDALKANHEGYRAFVSRIVKLRHELMDSDGYDLTVRQYNYSCDYCNETWTGDRLDYECPRCDAPMGNDLHVPLGAKKEQTKR